MKQKAIETAITAMLLDMTRYFQRFATIDNVGDKRYWETRLKYNTKQFTIDTSKMMSLVLSGSMGIDNSQNTAPTEINIAYIDETLKPVALSVKAKRRTVTIPFEVTIVASNFTEALEITEDIIDKAISGRVFNYALYGNQHRGQYRILYDVAQENTSSFDYSNTENGIELSFTVNMEMHYYATVHSSIPNITTIYVTHVVDIDAGMLDPDGNPILTQVTQQTPILISNTANVVNADLDIIRHAIANLTLLSNQI